MTADTPFPQRPSDEVVDHLSPDYRDPFNDVLEDRRETIAAGEGLRAARQRGRHGAAITLLRGLLSSPQTAETVLENRQKRLVAEGEDRVEATEEDLDATYRPRIMGALGGGKSAKANGARTLMSLFKRGIRRIRFIPRTYAPIPLLWTDWVS